MVRMHYPHERTDWAGLATIGLIALTILMALLGHGGWVIALLAAVMFVQLGVLVAGIGLLALGVWYLVQHPSGRLHPFAPCHQARTWAIVWHAPRSYQARHASSRHGRHAA